jgi:hypothetical protein
MINRRKALGLGAGSAAVAAAAMAGIAPGALAATGDAQPPSDQQLAK